VHPRRRWIASGILLLVCLLAWGWLALLDRGTSVTAVAVPHGEDAPLPGLYLAGNEPADLLVITAHGGLASKETTLEFCREARARGADCLAVDLAGHGASRRVAARRPAGDGAAGCAAMSEALAVLDRPQALGPAGPVYDRRVFIGHSLGAALGGGSVFPCSRSSCVGNPGACAGTSAVILGDTHRKLGLPDGPGYLLSHVLEPWDPKVVDRALTRHLPQRVGARRSIAVRALLLLLFITAGVLAGTGVAGALARRIRRQLGQGWGVAVLAGLASSMVVLATAASLARRCLWWLWPIQASDVWVGGATLLATLAIGGPVLAGMSVLHKGAPAGWFTHLAAMVLGVVPGLICAFGVPVFWGDACLSSGVIVLVPPLMVVVAVGVIGLRLLAGWRTHPAESLAFCGLMMAWTLALLTPGFR